MPALPDLQTDPRRAQAKSAVIRSKRFFKAFFVLSYAAYVFFLCWVTTVADPALRAEQDLRDTVCGQVCHAEAVSHRDVCYCRLSEK